MPLVDSLYKVSPLGCVWKKKANVSSAVALQWLNWLLWLTMLFQSYAKPRLFDLLGSRRMSATYYHLDCLEVRPRSYDVISWKPPTPLFLPLWFCFLVPLLWEKSSPVFQLAFTYYMNQRTCFLQRVDREITPWLLFLKKNQWGTFFCSNGIWDFCP